MFLKFLQNVSILLNNRYAAWYSHGAQTKKGHAECLQHTLKYLKILILLHL